MLVTVRLFARLRELADAGELPMDLPDGATVRDAWQTTRGPQPRHRAIRIDRVMRDQRRLLEDERDVEGRR